MLRIGALVFGLSVMLAGCAIESDSALRSSSNSDEHTWRRVFALGSAGVSRRSFRVGPGARTVFLDDSCEGAVCEKLFDDAVPVGEIFVVKGITLEKTSRGAAAVHWDKYKRP